MEIKPMVCCLKTPKKAWCKEPRAFNSLLFSCCPSLLTGDPEQRCGRGTPTIPPFSPVLQWHRIKYICVNVCQGCYKLPAGKFMKSDLLRRETAGV